MDGRTGGVVFGKMFPNPAEPYRGIFVADQARATASAVDWSVVAPVPWVPRFAARLFNKPYVRGDAEFDGRPLLRPRYPVLPKRVLYATVAPMIALTARPAFERACSAVGARFVHAHELYPSGAAARRLCARSGLPYVLTVHGLDLYSNLGNPRWRAEIVAAAHYAAGVVCVGTRLAHDCVVELEMDSRRVIVIPNTYDTDRFRAFERKRDSARTRIVTLGRLSHEKGHDVLLEAFSRALAAGAEMTLTLIGDGPERSALESQAAKLGISEQVSFTGTLLGEQVPVVFRESDVFVLPSRHEGFGVALIEAMATGLPVVATRSGGPQDIVTEADGLLTDPDDAAALADAMLRLLNTIDVYDCAAIARRTAERFSPRSVGERLSRLYWEVLHGTPLTGTLAEQETL